MDLPLATLSTGFSHVVSRAILDWCNIKIFSNGYIPMKIRLAKR